MTNPTLPTEDFEDAMQPLMKWLKARRILQDIPTNDGDYIGEQIDKVGQHIWDHWDD